MNDETHVTHGSASPVTVYVTYSGAAGDRFDRDWYVDRHLPLVMASWSRYGLEAVTAFFPAGRQGGTLALCECRFRDQVAVDAAFASPEAPAVMADVHHFTDIVPQRARAVSL